MNVGGGNIFELNLKQNYHEQKNVGMWWLLMNGSIDRSFKVMFLRKSTNNQFKSVAIIALVRLLVFFHPASIDKVLFIYLAWWKRPFPMSCVTHLYINCFIVYQNYKQEDFNYKK